MGAYRGGVRGNRGEATRPGTATSGIDSWVNSWQVKVSASLYKDTDGEARVKVVVSDYKKGTSVVLLDDTEEAVLEKLEFGRLLYKAEEGK